MWIFYVKHSIGGYAGMGSAIYRVNAGDNSGDKAIRKLWDALQRDRINMGPKTFEEFIESFDDDCTALLDHGEIRSVHPNDDHWVP